MGNTEQADDTPMYCPETWGSFPSEESHKNQRHLALYPACGIRRLANSMPRLNDVAVTLSSVTPPSTIHPDVSMRRGPSLSGVRPAVPVFTIRRKTGVPPHRGRISIQPIGTAVNVERNLVPHPQ